MTTLKEDPNLLTTPEEHQLRISVCKTCDDFQITPEDTTCLVCNCSGSLLFTYKAETCPLGKW